MFAILGAAGKAGHACATALRAQGLPVRAIVRSSSNAAPLAALGCDIAVADLQDSTTLAQAMQGASAVQIICPTAPQADDAAAEMRRSIESVATALEAAAPARVLAISDYGAQVEKGTGITLLFHALEQRLRRLPSQLIFLRSAEHMENWSRVFTVAARTGILPSLHHPLTKLFPTVSAYDVGKIAAGLLASPQDEDVSPCIVHVEGPRRYTPIDVATAMQTLLQREITAYALPRAAWEKTLLGSGLSESAIQLVTDLYDAHNAGQIDVEIGAREVRRGDTALLEALRPLTPSLSGI